MLRSVASTQHSSLLLAARASTVASSASTATAATPRRPFIPSKARQDGSYTAAKGPQRKPTFDTKQPQSPPHVRQPGQHAAQPSRRPPYHPVNVKPNPNGSLGSRQKARGDGVKLLRPAILSQRLTALCDEDKYDEAVEVLKNAPFDAKNAPVWNTVIRRMMEIGKFQLAYRLYIDMKRRGHAPTLRSYATMMKGYRSIEDWEPRSKILENAHSVYEDYFELATNLGKVDSIDRSAFNMYLRVLGKAGLFQKMFDVFNEMQDRGPFKPESRSYLEMLAELSDRRTIPGLGPLQVVQKNASDARYLWKIYSKEVEEGRMEPDVPTINVFLRALIYGTPSDNLVAFDIIRDYVGLSKPGETPLKPRVLVNTALVSTVLDVALAANKPKATIHFLQQLIDQPVPEGTIRPVDCGHIGQVLYAYMELAGKGSFGESKQALGIIEWTLRAAIEDPSYVNIAPDLRVYRNAFCCFWRCNDWPSAMRAFELMTGYSTTAFEDGVSGPPKGAPRSRHRTHIPDRPTLSWLARIALATQDPANMRVCLRILDHYNVSALFRHDGKGLPLALANDMETLTKKHVFWDLKLAETCVDLVDHTLLHKAPSNSKGRYTSEERDRWRALQSTASATVKWYRTHPKFPASYTPHEEISLLGSAQGLSATEKVVEQSIDRRYSKVMT